MTMNYAANLRQMPLKIVQLAFCLPQVIELNDLHYVVADRYPDAVLYRGYEVHSLMLPVSTGEQTKTTLSLMRAAVKGKNGKSWSIPQKHRAMTVHVPRVHHLPFGQGKEQLVPQDRLHDFISSLPLSLSNFIEGFDGTASPLAEDPDLESEGMIVNHIESIVLELGGEAHLLDVQAMVSRYLLEPRDCKLDRVLLTWKGRGIWIGKQPTDESNSALVESPDVARVQDIVEVK